MVLNTTSSQNTNLISTQQFFSFSIYITSFPRLVLDFILSSSFICENVSYSNKISEYSSSEIVSSDNAFKTRLLILLSAEIGNIAIFSCFSIFNDISLIARFPTTQSNSTAIDTASIAIAAGAATIVDRRPTPVIPNTIAVTSNSYQSRQ